MRQVGALEGRPHRRAACPRRPRPSCSRARPGRTSCRPAAAHSPIAKMLLVAGAAVRVDEDAAALRRRRGRQSRPSSSRGRMPAEKTTTSASMRRRPRGSRPATLPSSPRHACVRAPVCTFTPSCSISRLQAPRRPPSSSWTRHQPRRHLDDVRLEAELRAARWPPRGRADRHRSRRRCVARCLLASRIGLEVLDRAVDEAAVEVVARDRRHERASTGGEHQHVVRLARCRRRASPSCDSRSIASTLRAEPQLDAAGRRSCPRAAATARPALSAPKKDVSATRS